MYEPETQAFSNLNYHIMGPSSFISFLRSLQIFLLEIGPIFSMIIITYKILEIITYKICENITKNRQIVRGL